MQYRTVWVSRASKVSVSGISVSRVRVKDRVMVSVSVVT